MYKMQSKLCLLVVLATIFVIGSTTPVKELLKAVPNTPENLEIIKSGNYRQNIEELSGQTEGDMVLTKEQEQIVNGEIQPSHRTGLIDTNYRWPDNLIPFELSSVFSAEQEAHILLGISELEKISCLRFVRRTTEVNYVEVTGLAAGCYSNVGFLNRGRQQVNLQLYAPGEGCFRLGTIIHEFLHTLGFYHMQSATERDDFVRIAWENIQAGTEGNFNRYEADRITNFNVLYDPTSVMHYSAYGFTKNGFATIIPNDITLINILGQRAGMTELDIQRLNTMYQCSAV